MADYEYTAKQKPMRNAEHLTLVDHMRARLQEPGYQEEYLQNQADQRRREYDAEQDRIKKAAR